MPNQPPDEEVSKEGGDWPEVLCRRIDALLDMDNVTPRVPGLARQLLREAAATIKATSEANRKLRIEALCLCSYAERITPYVVMTEEADNLEAKLLQASAEVRAALRASSEADCLRKE